MKKTILSLCFLVCFSCFAQEKQNFIDRHLLGKEKTRPFQVSVDIFPFLFLSDGGGGSLSAESGHWQTGIIGFSVAPPDFVINTFFNRPESLLFRRNKALEVFVNYYLRKDRKGVYGGLLGGPEWFRLEDRITGATETIVKNYVVPRLGIRVFPFRKIFYTDASFGWSFNLGGTGPRSLGEATYNATGGGFIYFLQVGARFGLTRNSK